MIDALIDAPVSMLASLVGPGGLGGRVADDAGASAIIDKLAFLVPEMILFAGTCVVMMLGLSKSVSVRKTTAPVAILSVIAAGVAAALGPDAVPGSMLPNIIVFTKVLIAIVGVLLLLVMAGTIDRDFEDAVRRGKPFDPIRANRGEFYAFTLFSLTGLMLVASADDLIWLFLALELTSLPTYVMVSISTARSRSQEAGVKYFFLGALGAATFLMGFTLLYGASGTTQLFGEVSIASAINAERALTGGLSPIMLLGLVLSLIGVGFKVAAVPMHFYTADVYEGASSSVSAYLAFVPKTAGFVTMMLLLAAVGWGWNLAPTGEPVPAGALNEVVMTGGSLPEPVRVTLWVIAALTMTVGNVLAWQQTSLKRLLAYSSIAHSGYMIVGLIAGPGVASMGADEPQALEAVAGGMVSNGLGAVLFYLLAYGCMNVGAFAVLAALERRRAQGGAEEVDSVDALRGLCRSNPLLGWTMVLCGASLMGLPILLGFFGKLYLFTAGVFAGEYVLVVILALNSAIAAFYYLRLVFYPLTESRDDEAMQNVAVSPFASRLIACALSAGSVIVLVPFVPALTEAADHATEYRSAVELAAGYERAAAIAELREAMETMEAMEAGGAERGPGGPAPGVVE